MRAWGIRQVVRTGSLQEAISKFARRVMASPTGPSTYLVYPNVKGLNYQVPKSRI